MAANPELAKQRGLSEEAIAEIGELHTLIDDIVDAYGRTDDLYSTVATVRELEFRLQELWGFQKDSRYHTHVERIRRKDKEVHYLGNEYRCLKSGVSHTITEQDLSSHRVIPIGKGFIDFGSVVRIVGDIQKVQK